MHSPESSQPNTFSVAISDGGNGTINLALPLGAADACVLNASVDFDATLKPSSCAVAGGTLAFRTGHLTLDDAHQTMHFVADATASTTTTCAQHYDVTLSR